MGGWNRLGYLDARTCLCLRSLSIAVISDPNKCRHPVRAWCKKHIFLWALIQDRALKQQRGVWVVDSWNIQGLAFCFPVSELQVGAKVKQNCLVALLCERNNCSSSGRTFLVSFFRENGTDFCEPVIWIYLPSLGLMEFFLGPKARTDLLTVLFKEYRFLVSVAGAESLQALSMHSSPCL